MPVPMVELVEDNVPLEDIEQTVADLIELYGGEIRSSEAQGIDFTLPNRRGVAASGGVECRLSWSAVDATHGTVTMAAERDAGAPKIQQILLLLVGTLGALLWLLWPFFPELGTLSWIGAAVAFAAYFLTLKRTRGGLASDFLQRLVKAQRSEDVADSTTPSR